jgi:hypothetical protein
LFSTWLGIGSGIGHLGAIFVLDGANPVTGVLSVGGTTRIPYVKKVFEQFGQPVRRISGPSLSSVLAQSEVLKSWSRKQ